ncbi:cytochrome P450 315a1, mitochondrial-like isoform X1 [Varroa destructor]|uniref:Cytochrome P450 315a1, mitochondrial n=1 Tax=Varroa destructor TaxID=109461 RepID=A0A7M7KMC2_VARDE|nr:cytochrome P450 315a1, mitochondrial-like isoform X1 [Varroa destructor]
MLSNVKALLEVGHLIARWAASSALSTADSNAISACPFHALWAKRKPEKGNQADLPGVSNRETHPFEELPAPRALPLIGTTLDVIRFGGAPRIHEYCDHRHKQLGPIYTEKLGDVESVFVADSGLIQQVYANEGKYPQHMVPEAWTIYNEKKGIKRGLFFMEGPEWQECRRALNNVFLRPKTVSDHVPVFNEVIGDMVSRWGNISADNNGYLNNLERELYTWSIESLGAMIFGRRLGCISTAQHNTETEASVRPESIHEFVSCVQQIFAESAKMTTVSPKLASVLRLPMWRNFERAAGRALELARQLVEENVHKLNSVSHGGVHTEAGSSLIAQLIESNISAEELVSIVADLFLAAADTTSHATQWAFYLLSWHPEAQQKLLKEVQNAVGKGQTDIPEEALVNMPYVKAVIKETLRLYPVAPFLTRILDRDFTLNGYRIPAGKYILMSLYTMGRDPKNFSNPQAFCPERWLRENRAESQANSWACLPFGLGSRSCIGRRVAEIQMQFLLTRTVQRFEIAPGQEAKVGIKMRLITTPENPISLKLTSRE